MLSLLQDYVMFLLDLAKIFEIKKNLPLVTL